MIRKSLVHYGLYLPFAVIPFGLTSTTNLNLLCLDRPRLCIGWADLNGFITNVFQ